MSGCKYRDLLYAAAPLCYLGSLQIESLHQYTVPFSLSLSLSLLVVDVYQMWCGPCRAVVSLLRKIKNELGDDLLHFATVSPERN